MIDQANVINKARVLADKMESKFDYTQTQLRPLDDQLEMAFIILERGDRRHKERRADNE